MQFEFTPGNAFVCRINAHRQGWNGTICTDPENWNCLAESHFRADFCANGDPRCFHLHAFDAEGPSITVEQNGAEWLLGEHPDALDNQILFLWGFQASGPRGIPEGASRRSIIYGAYRVKSAEKFTRGHRDYWTIRPYPDGWMRCSDAGVPTPRYEGIGGPYINQFDAHAVDRILNLDVPDAKWESEDVKRRFESFRRSHDGWRTEARRLAEKLVARIQAAAPRESARPAAPAPASTLGNYALRDALKGLDVSTPAHEPAPAPVTPEAPPNAAADAAVLLDPEREAWIGETYGPDLARELRVAFATQDLVILRGDPGVGKSHLALRLLDDPERERTHIVSVGSTWRGREELFGYVNPIHGRFEATPFTDFARRAASAWKEGDRRPWVVVLEEFNLSQPEHWMADILAVSQYSEERDRIVHLGGDGDGPSELFLSPALRFVATINNDHTTRPLSPRVLDRAAVVTVTLTAKSALARAGLTLESSAASAIFDLDFELRPAGAAFTMRTARALAKALGAGIVDDHMAAADLVIAQQVLPKVRLSAHEPADVALLRRLVQWADARSRGMPRCAGMINEWKERLETDEDVEQA